MDKRSKVLAGIGVAVGAVTLAVDRFAKRRRCLVTVSQQMPASASAVLDLMKQVEREPEFIPIVSSVRVLERTGTHVRYTLRAARPLPGAVRYGKWWDESPPAVHWRSERGTMGFQHRGEVRFTEVDGGCVAHLWSEHWFMAPLAGRLAAPAAAPIVRAQLAAWLANLAAELAKGSG